jgi:hypothetical protein
MKRRNLIHDICRTIGHAWFEIDTTTKSQVGWMFWLQCERCGTQRRDTINLRGDLNSRNYVYAENYANSGKLTKQEYRAIVMQKLHPIRKKAVKEDGR